MNKIALDLNNELKNSFRKVGIKKNDNIYLTGNIALLAKIKLSKINKMNIFLNSLRTITGNNSTIFSPSASMNLCNTDIVFDINNTPSYQMGAFAEFFRNLPSSIRSNHPFWSISAIGKNANRLNNVSRHAFGVGSPWSLILDLNTKQINYGVHPSKAISLIHHVETVVGVPYRYTKEFIHPVLKNNKIIHEEYYQLVMYKNSDIKKKILLNEHFFDEMKKKELIYEFTNSSGLTFWSFKMVDFFNIALSFFKKDIYNYLEVRPKNRPYQK